LSRREQEQIAIENRIKKRKIQKRNVDTKSKNIRRANE
jgi:hypothetical protein